MPKLSSHSIRLFTNCVTVAHRLEQIFLCLLLSSMIILACLQILMRSMFSSGFMWADPLLRYLVLWSGLFGAAAATRQGKHISIDVASYLLPEKVQPWLQVALNLFATVVCLFLTYAAILFVTEEASYGGRALLSIPSWLLNMAFPLAFGLISLRFLIRAISGAAKMATADQPSRPEAP